MHRIFVPLLLFCAVSFFAPRPATATVVTTSWSPVGNPGNAADPSTGFGSVNYAYSIGTYDVTVSQYVAFLNANDPNGSDPLGLFNTNMASFGSVTLNGSAPSGSMYAVAQGNGNLPVNCVNWYDAARFANWMNNG
jgi:formylglycine-generating enzyme